jgi:hypothetical protein
MARLPGGCDDKLTVRSALGAGESRPDGAWVVARC